MGDESQPNPHISDSLKTLLNWGLLVKQDEFGKEVYIIHTLVKDFSREEAEKEELDRRELLIRAAQYYENLAKMTRNLWDLLKARDYYYMAEEWEKADDIVEAAQIYLVRWGHIELVMNLLEESAETTLGTRKATALGNLATIYQGLGDYKTALKLHIEVREIFESEGQRENVAVSLHQLGNVHYLQGNYKEAVKFYQQSLNLKETLDDKRGIAETLFQLGQLDEKKEDYVSTLEKYLQALFILKELNDPRKYLAESDIFRLREKMGEEAFKKALEDIRRKHGT